MKKLLKPLFALSILCLLFSFTQKETKNYIGTFGVSDSDPAAIELQILENNTYLYQDFSNPSKKIEAKGKWKLKNKKIHLLHSKDLKFHDNWKISKDGIRATSRKGLLYYSLIRK